MTNEKTLKFTVVNTRSYTYEVPMNKVKEFLKESDEDTSKWNEVDMADFLYNYSSFADELDTYENEEVYSDSYIQDEEITE